MQLHHNRPGAFLITPVDGPNIEVDGETNFEVDDPDLARRLLEQDDNYSPADEESRALLDDIAAGRQAREHVEEAVADGDTAAITARDLIASLDTLTADELADVRTTEEAGPNRKTVLARIDELLAAAGEEA